MEYNSEPSKIYRVCIINRMHQSTYTRFTFDSKYCHKDDT